MSIYLMKFGGNAIRGKEDLDRLAAEMAQLVKKGAKIILVHGGGPEITAEIEKRGMRTTMAGGFRITDDEVLKVADEVLKGLNDDVLDSLKKAGVKAKGMPGYEGNVISCVKKEPITVKDGETTITVDLGLVGEVDKVRTEYLKDLLSQEVLPVIYPICADGSGSRMNVNADTVASGIAAAAGCRELIFITDVPGILRNLKDPGSKIDSVTLEDIDALIADGTISGGMIPKVEACRKAILSGVSAVRMVNGKDKESIVSDVMDNKPHGTLITR
ncbi:MAG: acetylglutamate kinase [Methanomassiliicoccaceae archaeon]|jgi:acetylglutamate kinase|nr:acetylglutamate kinase [Methanomassiliicoccaceae archaeon]